MSARALLLCRLGLCLVVSGCAAALHSSAREPVVVEQLFFGRNHGGAQVVSDSLWSDFLAQTVTPRFPNGYTVLASVGQWRGADGRSEREAGFVLELVHPASAAADSSIRAIVAAYEARFQQESVLRVVLSGHAAF